MSYTSTATATNTYTAVDVETVIRRVTADLVMIAASSGAITEAKAREYGHDIELLAQKGYLRKADVTLFSGATEIKAACFEINTTSGNLEMSRPGGVRWPQVSSPYLRVVLSYNSSYTDEARGKMSGKLKTSWTPSNADTSHAGLKAVGGRDYISNGYGMQRKDFGA